MFSFITLFLSDLAFAAEEIDCSRYQSDPTLFEACRIHNGAVVTTEERVAALEAKMEESKPIQARAAPVLVPMTRAPAAMTGARPTMSHVLTVERPSDVAGAGAVVCVSSGGWLEVAGPDTVQVYADTTLDGVFRPDVNREGIPEPHTCVWASTPAIHVVAPAQGEALFYFLVESSQGVSGYPAWVVQKTMKFNRDAKFASLGGFTREVRMPKHRGEL